jgi:hypothetical protein
MLGAGFWFVSNGISTEKGNFRPANAIIQSKAKKY